MDAGNVEALVAAVWERGARLALSLDGRLIKQEWHRLPPELRRRVERHIFEVVALLCRDPRYRLTDDQLALLRGWTAWGELDTVREALWAEPGVRIPAGEAAGRAAYWLGCFDAGYEHSEQFLRGLYYGALVYQYEQTRR